MQQQNDRRVRVAGFAIEHANAVGFDAFAMNHRNVVFVIRGCGCVVVSHRGLLIVDLALDAGQWPADGIISIAQTAAGRMYMGARKFPVSSHASGVRNQ